MAQHGPPAKTQQQRNGHQGIFCWGSTPEQPLLSVPPDAIPNIHTYQQYSEAPSPDSSYEWASSLHAYWFGVQQQTRQLTPAATQDCRIHSISMNQVHDAMMINHIILGVELAFLQLQTSSDHWRYNRSVFYCDSDAPPLWCRVASESIAVSFSGGEVCVELILALFPGRYSNSMYSRLWELLSTSGRQRCNYKKWSLPDLPRWPSKGMNRYHQISLGIPRISWQCRELRSVGCGLK